LENRSIFGEVKAYKNCANSSATLYSRVSSNLGDSSLRPGSHRTRDVSATASPAARPLTRPAISRDDRPYRSDVTSSNLVSGLPACVLVGNGDGEDAAVTNRRYGDHIHDNTAGTGSRLTGLRWGTLFPDNL